MILNYALSILIFQTIFMKDMYICYYDLNNLKNNSNNLILMEVGRQKLLHFYIDNN